MTDEGFKWGFNTAISTIAKEQRHIYWILGFGYAFTDKTNKNITIHYGNNPPSNMIRNIEIIEQQNKSTASTIIVVGCVVAFFIAVIVISVSKRKKEKR